MMFMIEHFAWVCIKLVWVVIDKVRLYCRKVASLLRVLSSVVDSQWNTTRRFGNVNVVVSVQVTKGNVSGIVTRISELVRWHGGEVYHH